MFAVQLVGILQGVERPGSVYSIMPQWWHLMVLQYVAASFHLPSVSTTDINILQYPKPYKQCEIPTIPAVVISKVLLPQSNIMTAFVHCHRWLFCDISSSLQTYRNHNVTQFTVLFIMVISCWTIKTLPKISNSTFCSLIAYWSGPRERWREKVERDLQMLGVRRWRQLVIDREKWRGIVRQAKTHSRP